jgi:hypothetical protein
MKKIKNALIIILLLNMFMLVSCDAVTERLMRGTEIASGKPEVVEKSPDFSPTSEFNTVSTEIDEGASVEATVNTMLTEAAELYTDTPMPPTETLAPTETVMPTSTLPSEMMTELAASLTAMVETSTPTETLAPTATNTEVVTPTATGVPCLAARFVADVTIPDGSVIQPNQYFYKTWRVQNIGSCIWGPNFAIVYKSGFQLGGKNPTYLGKGVNIHPDRYVNLTIQFRSPAQGGSFTSDWWLQDDLGNTFGVGNNFDESFYVQILVPGSSSDGSYNSPVSTDPPFIPAP